jgi:hypothetical protein
MCAAEDEEITDVVAPATFIVRVSRDSTGRLNGVVERVATGEKARFQGAEAMAALVQRMTPKTGGLR